MKLSTVILIILYSTLSFAECEAPQPDRAGKSASEIIKVSGKQKINLGELPEDVKLKKWSSPTSMSHIPNDEHFGFGRKKFSFEKKMGGHGGSDMGGTELIFAASAGKVVYVLDSCKKGDSYCGNAWGNHIVIHHGSGIYTRYAHLKKNSAFVKVGDSVERGQKISKMGTTGMSNGVHLHFELGIGSKKGKIDPCGPPQSFENVYNPGKLNLIRRPRPPFIPKWCVVNPGKGESSYLRRERNLLKKSIFAKVKKGIKILLIEPRGGWYHVKFSIKGRDYGLKKPLYIHASQVKCEY
jgi:murein DD-endopeptidase MepM/ murein hydrolase activator NlpD